MKAGVVAWQKCRFAGRQGNHVVVNRQKDGVLQVKYVIGGDGGRKLSEFGIQESGTPVPRERESTPLSGLEKSTPDSNYPCSGLKPLHPERESSIS